MNMYVYGHDLVPPSPNPEITYTLPDSPKIVEVPVIITAQDGTKNAFEVELEKVSEDVRISSILIDGIDKTTYDEETKTYTGHNTHTETHKHKSMKILLSPSTFPVA